ncbi:MAG: DUF805 domain-containing protein [Phascolarctobacterium sp.]|uniref:DUF805 domain-containing protein n=1 Tax=Phascolarctobacterium sp. TaxID=2049039 RepID=UPI0025DB1224|nr:DUF805 domain-containing protein [Phascolarctobacterium sp.]MCC8157756.1 DUF805 domain-containing protein [Phascolarctobacterium sp.]
MDFQEMFFTFDGRLNRRPYILRFLLRNAIIWCLGLIIAAFFTPGGTMFEILAFALTFIAALSCLSLYVRRLHDLDHGPLMVLLAFIPLISFFFAIYLMFFRGMIGPNSYGPDPLADGRGIDAW